MEWFIRESTVFSVQMLKKDANEDFERLTSRDFVFNIIAFYHGTQETLLITDDPSVEKPPIFDDVMAYVMNSLRKYKNMKVVVHVVWTENIKKMRVTVSSPYEDMISFVIYPDRTAEVSVIQATFPDYKSALIKVMKSFSEFAERNGIALRNKDYAERALEVVKRLRP